MATKYIPGRIDFSSNGLFNSKALNIPTINQCSEAVYVTGPHMGEAASNIDPWVKVGTTTIDGTPEQVASIFGCSVVDLCSTIDDSVWCIGGRSIRVAHWFGDPSAVMLHCDIVRRQSEIEAEARMRPCINCEEHLCDTQFCESCVEGFRAMEPPCPECGPHGNRGEVLLASSWAKCTTCAGGKPGDLWGEVKPSEEPKYWSSVANKMVTFAEALALGRSLRRPEDEM